MAATALCCLLTAQARAEPHPPQTPAEHALDAILRFADQDDDLLDNLFDGRGESAFHRTVDYSAMLTQPLLASLRRQEKRLVKQNCSGSYVGGEVCGMDSSPITCGQDHTQTYFYETNAAAGATATITYSDTDWGLIATYQMVLQGGRWMLGGVHCLQDD